MKIDCKTLVYTLSVALFCSCVPSITMAASNENFDDDPVVICFSHTVAETTPKGKMALKFKELAEKNLPGRVQVEVYPNSELFTDDNVFEALLLGDVQMAAPAFSKFSKYTSQLQIFDLPFLFDDMDAVEAFQKSTEGQGLLLSLTDRGFVGLGFFGNSFKQLSANRKLQLPQDAKGLKFRIMSSDILKEQFKIVGAEAIPKPFSQVYPMLANGILDGQENTWLNMYSKKLHTVQPYITESNHGVLGYMVITSADCWDAFDDDEKEILQDALNQAIEIGNKETVKVSERAKKQIIVSNTSEVYTLTFQELQKWRKAMHPVWKHFEKEIGKDLIDKAVSTNNM